MQEVADDELLRRYSLEGSEEAFAALVARHVNLVHSAAIRQTGNPHAAEEITQVVFTILASKAARLPRKTILAGWLYQTARFTAANFLRNEIRRARREQEAYLQSTSNETQPAAEQAWQQIAPLLEDAMGRLGDKDRAAILLRFFEGKTMQEVGATENAAKKRINRALGKLRRFFARRGVASTTAIIAGVISANAVQAAPVALTQSVAGGAIASGAVSASTLALLKGTLKLMAWTKVKTAAISVGALLVCGAGLVAVKHSLPAESGAGMGVGDAGIGMVIGGRKNQGEPLRLQVVYPGSPAQRTGIKANGFLISINGTNVVSLSVSQAVSMVMGPAGTSLTLEIADATMRQTNRFTVKRSREWSYPAKVRFTAH
jgi:RNA polymerase sigma factor (sigma-70 family)